VKTERKRLRETSENITENVTIAMPTDFEIKWIEKWDCDLTNVEFKVGSGLFLVYPGKTKYSKC
jgi:hypothetical protein